MIAIAVLCALIGSADAAAVKKRSVSQESATARMSIVLTAVGESPEFMLFNGGALFKKRTLNYSAFLIEHGDESILFDTGLGDQVREQVAADMPIWAKPLFRYRTLPSARAAISDDQKAKIKRLFLSHIHWDHASGLVDWPETAVWLPKEEMDFREVGHPPAVLPSQLRIPAERWKTFEFSGPALKGFSASFDVFGDGSVVAVPLGGHTPGSIGLFVKTVNRTYFVVGDLVWAKEGLEKEVSKFWAAAKIVDIDQPKIKAEIRHVHQLMTDDPALVVIPAHDSHVQDGLGYYPKWVD